MVWLWYTLLINLHVIPLVTKIIAFIAMTGISVTTVILFKRVFNSDFILDGWTISRRKVALRGGISKSSSDNEGKCNSGSSSNPSGAEADLYEPMADSFSSGDDSGDTGARTQANGTEESSSYSLRKRLNGAEVVAATTAAAVNN